MKQIEHYFHRVIKPYEHDILTAIQGLIKTYLALIESSTFFRHRNHKNNNKIYTRFQALNCYKHCMPKLEDDNLQNT